MPVGPKPPWQKISWEAFIVLVALIAVVTCMIRWKPSFRGIEGITQTSTAKEAHDDHEDTSNNSDCDDWTVDQLVVDSLGLKAQPLSPQGAALPTNDAIPKYIETHYSSWKNLFQMITTLGKFWGALVWMYWSLLNDNAEMMDCEAYPKSLPRASLIVNSCHYTRSCLHGFPVVAANVALVLMLRTILQHRLYYSMLQRGYLVVFQGIPVLNTFWPLVTALSMGQGALHFVLHAYCSPETQTLTTLFRLIRKFVLPGAVFFLIMFQYSDVENTLVPLNHLAELEISETQQHSPWLTKLLIIDERVLSFDVRHRDVFAETQLQLGRPPTLDDILQSVIDSYDASNIQWHAKVHKQWGLFRSMWPAAILIDKRLDRTDQPTRQWLYTCAIISGGCIFMSLLSVYVLLACTAHIAWATFFSDFKTLFTEGYISDAGRVVVNGTVLAHAVLIIVFLHHAILNMFYFSLKNDGHKEATHDSNTSSSSSQDTPPAQLIQ